MGNYKMIFNRKELTLEQFHLLPSDVQDAFRMQHAEMKSKYPDSDITLEINDFSIKHPGFTENERIKYLKSVKVRKKSQLIKLNPIINNKRLKMNYGERKEKLIKDKKARQKAKIDLKKQRFFEEERAHQRARDLRIAPPKSEQWFWKHYREHAHPMDCRNIVFCKFIPDVVNHYYKYVIEVDGSIHNNKEQKHRDFLKDRVFQSQGYVVIRVKDNDYEDLKKCIDQVKTIRNAQLTTINEASETRVTTIGPLKYAKIKKRML